jgi:hypothetical protein
LGEAYTYLRLEMSRVQSTLRSGFVEEFFMCREGCLGCERVENLRNSPYPFGRYPGELRRKCLYAFLKEHLAGENNLTDCLSDEDKYAWSLLLAVDCHVTRILKEASKNKLYVEDLVLLQRATGKLGTTLPIYVEAFCEFAESTEFVEKFFGEHPDGEFFAYDAEYIVRKILLSETETMSSLLKGALSDSNVKKVKILSNNGVCVDNNDSYEFECDGDEANYEDSYEGDYSYSEEGEDEEGEDGYY